MNAYTATVLINLGLISLTAFAIYFTGSLWAILILLFCVSAKQGKKKKKDKDETDIS